MFLHIFHFVININPASVWKQGFSTVWVLILTKMQLVDKYTLEKDIYLFRHFRHRELDEKSGRRSKGYCGKFPLKTFSSSAVRYTNSSLWYPSMRNTPLPIPFLVYIGAYRLRKIISLYAVFLWTEKSLPIRLMLCFCAESVRKASLFFAQRSFYYLSCDYSGGSLSHLSGLSEPHIPII